MKQKHEGLINFINGRPSTFTTIKDKWCSCSAGYWILLVPSSIRCQDNSIVISLGVFESAVQLSKFNLSLDLPVRALSVMNFTAIFCTCRYIWCKYSTEFHCTFKVWSKHAGNQKHQIMCTRSVSAFKHCQTWHAGTSVCLTNCSCSWVYPWVVPSWVRILQWVRIRRVATRSSGNVTRKRRTHHDRILACDNPDLAHEYSIRIPDLASERPDLAREVINRKSPHRRASERAWAP